MADRRRIVTLDSTGTATTVVDLETVSALQAVRDSFKVTAPQANQVVAQRQRRYAGGRVVGETHNNGAISETLLVQGATADIALANASSVYSALQAARVDLFFEWRPDGASNSTFYEVRGPAVFDVNYQSVPFGQGAGFQVTVTIPTGPLARLTPQSFTLSSTALPAVFAMTGIGGDAPALADVTLRSGQTATAAAPIWALFGWWKHPTVTPIAGSVSPLGIIEAETATGLSGFASASSASARGGTALSVTTSGAGTATASLVVDPSVLAADDFSIGEIDVEMWARIYIETTVVSPRSVLSLTPDAGTSFGSPTYTPEFGSAGKTMVSSASGGAWRWYRLGTLTMPVDPAQPVKWRAKIDMSWAAGSSGPILIDYFVSVPARARACSKSGVAPDSAYPQFIKSTSDTTKTIRTDLSGLVGSGTANKGRDSGLGGSLIELPPGDVDMLLKLSTFVADDPTPPLTNEQLSHTVTGTVTVWPRVFLAKGT